METFLQLLAFCYINVRKKILLFPIAEATGLLAGSNCCVLCLKRYLPSLAAKGARIGSGNQFRPARGSLTRQVLVSPKALGPPRGPRSTAARENPRASSP
jgi:hypothetical protein